jgi:hypothetical protein
MPAPSPARRCVLVFIVCSRSRLLSRGRSCRSRSRHPGRSSRWGRGRGLLPREGAWSCSLRAPGAGPRQPLGSIPDPSPARTSVVVFIACLCCGSVSAVGVDPQPFAGAKVCGRVHRILQVRVRVSRWGRFPTLARRGRRWWCASSSSCASAVGVDPRSFAGADVGGRVHRLPLLRVRQPLGSIPDPCAARTWVVVCIVILLCVSRPGRFPGRRRPGCGSWRSCDPLLQPLGSIPAPWPARMRVAARMGFSPRQPLGTSPAPRPARMLVIVRMLAPEWMSSASRWGRFRRRGRRGRP